MCIVLLIEVLEAKTPRGANGWRTKVNSCALGVLPLGMFHHTPGAGSVWFICMFVYWLMFG